MKITFKGVVLVCAMCAVAIMCVGLLVYDYIPSGLTVAKANEYEASPETTEALSGATEAQKLLTEQSTSSSGGNKPAVKTNIVLKEYDVSKADIASAKRTGVIDPGKPDPFAEVSSSSTGNAGTPTGTGSTSGSSTSGSDGTYYNSSKVK